LYGEHGSWGGLVLVLDQVSAWLFDVMRRNPDMARLFILGFISRSAAHTIAD
jgi:hypothetical protein